jgi:hypothetical protein
VKMAWILWDDLPDVVQIFIDDAGIKGPKSDYSRAVLPENPGIRHFIWEYAVALERVCGLDGVWQEFCGMRTVVGRAGPQGILSRTVGCGV